MKMVTRVLLTAAAIAALAAPAMAADKLIVKDAAGTVDVFKVDDAGAIQGKKLGMGTSLPQSPIHLHLPTSLGAVTDASNKVYSVSSGMSMSAQDNSSAAAFIVADGTNTVGMRGSVTGVRARGTLAVPTAPQADDLVFSVLGGIWDGAAIRNTAEVGFAVDGAVSSNIAPQRIYMRTKTGGTGSWYERLTIKNDGKVGINTPAPASVLHVTGLPVYADNATAKAALGGATAVGAFYTDGAGNVKVVY